MYHHHLSVQFWIGNIIMNKVVLSIFVILVIGMAELPSTFGCSAEYLTTTTSTTTTTTKPNPNPNGGYGYPYGGYGYRYYRSVDKGGNVFELEMEGFSICNTDGTEGLTFNEINACRVNYNFTQYVDTLLIVNIFGILDPFRRICGVFLADCF